MKTEGGSTLPKATGTSLEEISATDAWRALGPNLRRLLTIALPQRNLPVAIRMMAGVAPSMATEMAERLLAEDSNVRCVIDLYATGVIAKPAAKVEPARPATVGSSAESPIQVAPAPAEVISHLDSRPVQLHQEILTVQGGNN